MKPFFKPAHTLLALGFELANVQGSPAQTLVARWTPDQVRDDRLSSSGRVTKQDL
jgi:hypothetical protein